MKVEGFVIKEVQLKAALIRLIDEDVLEVHTTPDHETLVEDVDEINRVTRQLVGDKPHYVIVFVGTGSTASGKVREYAARETFRKNIVAEAIIITTLATRILATMYMKFARPKQKIKVVNSKEEAVKWIYNLKKTE